jgi:hypothetical protein
MRQFISLGTFTVSRILWIDEKAIIMIFNYLGSQCDEQPRLALMDVI